MPVVHTVLFACPSGVLVQLCYPYPRAVSEPAVYEDANVVTTGLTDEEVEQLKERLNPKSSSSIATKRSSSVPQLGEQGGGAGNASSRAGSISVSPAQYKPDLSVGRTHCLVFDAIICIHIAGILYERNIFTKTIYHRS